MKNIVANTFKKTKNVRTVVFEYYSPYAGKVEVGGTFNDWTPAQTPLKKDRQGNWKVSLSLAPGRYEYRYFVDGDWENDQRPVECVPNVFGGWNCVVQVA